MFSFSTAVLGTLLGLSAVQAQSTPAQIIENLNLLTEKTGALQTPAESLNEVNGPLLAVGMGPFSVIIPGLDDIVQSAQTNIPTVDDDTQSQSIYEAYSGLESTSEKLLETLISKAGLFKAVPFIGQPVVQALRMLEGMNDQLGPNLATGISSRASQILALSESFDTSIEDAETAYGGVDIDAGGSR